MNERLMLVHTYSYLLFVLTYTVGTVIETVVVFVSMAEATHDRMMTANYILQVVSQSFCLAFTLLILHMIVRFS